MRTVAALYVDVDGVYAGRSDVDCWDGSRDARGYPGPWPVVAHPPCERWGRWWWADGSTEPGHDGGCFAAALASVERWGGVLEHPAGSAAWARHRLPDPPAGGGWVRGLFRPGWSCHVEQGHYGHRARKPTWLYYVGGAPVPLLWGAGPDVLADRAAAARGRQSSVTIMGRRERRHTPPGFATLLLGIARATRGGA